MDRNYHKRKEKDLVKSFFATKNNKKQLKIHRMQPRKMLQKKYNKTVRLK